MQDVEIKTLGTINPHLRGNAGRDRSRLLGARSASPIRFEGDIYILIGESQ